MRNLVARVVLPVVLTAALRQVQQAGNDLGHVPYIHTATGRTVCY